ncbi:MAG: FliO/MopB family protein [bacterium]
MDYAWEILKIVFYLLIIVGGLYGGAFFVKKHMQKSQQGNMKVMARLMLTNKNALSLINVKDKVFLLGISDEKVSKLHTWEKEEFNEELESDNEKLIEKTFHQIFLRESDKQND